jgi:hypothetical protein
MTRRAALRSAGVAGLAAAGVAAPGIAAADDRPAPPPPPGPGPARWTEFELKDRRAVLAAGLSEAEADAWLLMNRAGAKLLALPQQHPSDLPDMVDAIHVIQNKLLARTTYRRYLDAHAGG